MELTPDFSVIINGQMNFPKDRVISIRTTDEAGIVSDSCEIELDDFDDALRVPNTEAKVEISLGYQETGLTKIGIYFVKEISIDGAQKVIRLKCNAVPKSMRSQKTKNNSGELYKILSNITSETGFSPAISTALHNVNLIDGIQFAESDISYITRISRKLGAIANPVSEYLVVAEDGTGKSISGKTLPTKYIDAEDVPNYACHFRETKSGNSAGTVCAALTISTCLYILLFVSFVKSSYGVYERKSICSRNQFKKYHIENESSCRRLLRKPLRRVRSCLQILLCFVHESFFRSC